MIYIEVKKLWGSRGITLTINDSDYLFSSEKKFKEALPILAGFMYVLDMSYPDKVGCLGYKLRDASKRDRYVFNVGDTNLYSKNGNLLELINYLVQRK